MRSRTPKTNSIAIFVSFQKMATASAEPALSADEVGGKQVLRSFLSMSPAQTLRPSLSSPIPPGGTPR